MGPEVIILTFWLSTYFNIPGVLHLRILAPEVALEKGWQRINLEYHPDYTDFGASFNLYIH